MPFDPSLPAPNSPLQSQVMRDQLNALNDDIQTRVMEAQLIGAIDGTSANTNAVDVLSMNADANYDQGQMQLVIQKIDQLILALRR